MIHLHSHLENKTHILWDWNGTLLDDVELCIESISHVLETNGLSAISKAEYLDRFGFPIVDYYKRLGFDFEKHDFPTVTNQFVTKYASGLPGCSLHQGAKELLRRLSESGKVQCVLSAAKETDLKRQLEDFGIIDFFQHVYGIQDHYAVSKVDRGKELLNLLHVSRENVILVGDTDHDLEVAAALEIDLLLLEDGHQHPDRLKKLGAKVIKRSE